LLPSIAAAALLARSSGCRSRGGGRKRPQSAIVRADHRKVDFVFDGELNDAVESVREWAPLGMALHTAVARQA
jgi:hypothetical protein